MAFPTIPTVAAGRVVATTQANATATRQFPDISALTYNPGDRLILIAIAYQTGTGTDAAFSGWTTGWTEIGDRATTTTMAIGVAERVADGSETGGGGPLVTQANPTGHCALIMLAIPGAHPTTPSEVSPKTDGTSSAASAAAFDPSGWGTEDTLWIAVGGSGETGTAGSYTGITTAPANFTDTAATAASGDVVGAVQGAVAFRQLAAASASHTGWTVDLSNARNSTVIIAVRQTFPPNPLTGFFLTQPAVKRAANW